MLGSIAEGLFGQIAKYDSMVWALSSRKIKKIRQEIQKIETFKYLQRNFSPFCPEEISPIKLKRYTIAPSSSTPSTPSSSMDTAEKVEIEEAKIDEIQQFSSTIKFFESYYHDWRKTLKEYESVQSQILAGIECFDINRLNFLYVASNFFPDHYSAAEDWASQSHKNYKNTSNLSPFISSIIKGCIIYQAQEQLKEHIEKLEKFKTDQSLSDSSSKKLKKTEKKISQLHRLLEKDGMQTLAVGESSLGRLTSRLSAIPLAKMLELPSRTAGKLTRNAFKIFKNMRGFVAVAKTTTLQKEWLHSLKQPFHSNCEHSHFTTEQDELFQEMKEFFTSLENCLSLEEIEEKFYEQGIAWELPPTVYEFQEQMKSARFRRHIANSYYFSVGQEILSNEMQDIQSLASKREQEREDKIDAALPFILEHLDKCKSLTLPEIRTYLAALHIHLREEESESPIEDDPLDPPPLTKLEWDQCVQEEEFCRALAGEWVDFQEETSYLIEQISRQALLSKHHIERKFVFFRAAEYLIGMVSAIIQLGLCAPQAQLWMVSSVLELFFKDLSKLGVPGIGILYIGFPFYPNPALKLGHILLSLAEHFFAVKYKPNEYSFESYQISFKIQLVELMLTGHYLRLLIEQALLWVNNRLIENLIMKTVTKSLDEDERMVEMTNQYEENRLNCKRYLQELQGDLNRLRLEDAKLIINRKNPGQSDPFEEISQKLEEVDIDYFPSEVLHFFEDHMGYQLTNANKEKFKHHLEKLFSQGEDDFIQSFQQNRFAELKN